MTTHSSLALLEEKMFGKRNPPAKKSAPVLCEKTDALYHSIAVRAIEGCQVYVCHHCATIIDGPGTTYYDAYDTKRKRNHLDDVGPNSSTNSSTNSSPMAILRKICRPCYRNCCV
jgi:hypothetical protein